MFYDWWLFCLVATATFNFEKGLFQMTSSKPLKQYDSSLVQLLGKGQFKIAKIVSWFGCHGNRKLPVTYNGKMVKLHFYVLPKMWQVYYVIPSKILSVRLSVWANIQG